MCCLGLYLATFPWNANNMLDGHMTLFSNAHLIRAVLFDVDGTLYYQHVLRCLITLELGTLPMTRRSFTSACRVWRALRCFRRVREELRYMGEAEVALASLQFSEAAKQSGEDFVVLESLVAEWLYQRPLKYLRLCRRRGLATFIDFLARQGIQVGVFSDYPVADKIKRLGFSEVVSVALCATDTEINAFKPHPKGFLHACTLWSLAPAQVLYVGDRPEVDATGATNAGMPCVILSRRERSGVRHQTAGNYVTVSSFGRLQYAFDSRR
jgi:HAD superfamily hydrolase (TIGR01549 family)